MFFSVSTISKFETITRNSGARFQSNIWSTTFVISLGVLFLIHPWQGSTSKVIFYGDFDTCTSKTISPTSHAILEVSQNGKCQKCEFPIFKMTMPDVEAIVRNTIRFPDSRQCKKQIVQCLFFPILNHDQYRKEFTVRKMCFSKTAIFEEKHSFQKSQHVIFD